MSLNDDDDDDQPLVPIDLAFLPLARPARGPACEVPCEDTPVGQKLVVGQATDEQGSDVTSEAQPDVCNTQDHSSPDAEDPSPGGSSSPPTTATEKLDPATPIQAPSMPAKLLETKVMCPSRLIGRVIGAGGDTVKHLQDMSGTHITIDQSGPQGVPKVITIRGTTQKVRTQCSSHSSCT